MPWVCDSRPLEEPADEPWMRITPHPGGSPAVGSRRPPLLGLSQQSLLLETWLPPLGLDRQTARPGSVAAKKIRISFRVWDFSLPAIHHLHHLDLKHRLFAALCPSRACRRSSCISHSISLASS